MYIHNMLISTKVLLAIWVTMVMG